MTLHMQYDHSTPFLRTKNNIVTDVGKAFIAFTGYTEQEILYMHIDHIGHQLLRIASELSGLKLNERRGAFLFTQSLDVKKVELIVLKEENQEETTYIFSDQPNKLFENRFLFLKQICMENIVGVAIYTAQDYILLKANQSYFNFLDLPFNQREYSIGKKIDDIIPTFISSELESICTNVITQKQSYSIKNFGFKSVVRGTTYWDLSITPLIEDDTVGYIMITIKDITERVLTKEKIEQQAQIVETIIENMCEALFIFDRNGNLIKTNKAAQEYISPNQPLNSQKAYDLFNFCDLMGNEIPHDTMPVNRMLKGEGFIQDILLLKSPSKDRYLNISGIPLFDDAGNLSMAVLVSRDVSDFIRYEEAIKKQRNYLYNLFNTLDLPILRLSYPDFRVIEINKKASSEILDIVGFSRSFEKFLKEGRSIYKLLPFIRRIDYIQYIRELEVTKNPVYINNLQIRKQGQTAYINLIFQPILNARGEIVEVLITSVDITTEVKQKAELERTIELKDEFLSIISHEFKTPLTVIHAAVQALQCLCKNDLSERSLKFVDKIKQNTYRQLRLINNLLDITRAKAGQIKVKRKNMDIVFITKAITDSVSLFAEQKDVMLSFSSTLKKKIIAIDEEKYERILLNLLSNAIKFTPEGKTVCVKVSMVKDQVCIKVKDRGVGIPKKKHKLIFERFGQVDSSLTRQAEGTGIGLSLVKLLIDSLEGKIFVDSEEGKGSTFTVYLPSVKVNEILDEQTLKEATDSRLVQMTAIEFADIYLSS